MNLSWKYKSWICYVNMYPGTVIHTKERKVSELNFFFILKSRSSIQLLVEEGGGGFVYERNSILRKVFCDNSANGQKQNSEKGRIKISQHIFTFKSRILSPWTVIWEFRSDIFKSEWRRQPALSELKNF